MSGAVQETWNHGRACAGASGRGGVLEDRYREKGKAGEVRATRKVCLKAKSSTGCRGQGAGVAPAGTEEESPS